MKEKSKECDLLLCYNCNAPLSENKLVKRAYTQNGTVGWAKKQLKILADIAEDRELSFFAKEIRRIMEGMTLLDV